MIRRVIRVSTSKTGRVSVEFATGWKAAFECSAEVRKKDSDVWASATEWKAVGKSSTLLKMESVIAGVTQRVSIERRPAEDAVIVRHVFENPTSEPVCVKAIRTLDGTLTREAPAKSLHYLHSLNARADLPVLCPLVPGEPSLLLGRVNFTFFEGLVISPGAGAPCMVTGALTQNIVHRTQQITWDGAGDVRLETGQELRGIEWKEIPAHGELLLDSVYLQSRADGELNTVFEDYLGHLLKRNGTRWENNCLRKEYFYDPWNNNLYWEAREDDLLEAAHLLRRYFPTLRWMGIDDGYQKSTVHPTLERSRDGGRVHDLDTEMIWWRNSPGIAFAFPGSLGEDTVKLPKGMMHLAQAIRDIGLRPGLWLGLEVGETYPLAAEHPEWFHALRFDTKLLLDVSIPEVRDLIEAALRKYLNEEGYHAVKLDFWSLLFEYPYLKFSRQEKTAAEWRAWFFETVRACLPDDGYINLACDIAGGAPFLSRWVDSYRPSADLRDGDWYTVKNNVRWSLVPLLTHGFKQPIADADSLSNYRGLALNELCAWADYAYVTGSLVELGGNVKAWDKEDVEWLKWYIDRPCAGERVWFCDPDGWIRDGGLPRVVAREMTPGTPGAYLVSLHNWGDQPITIGPADWSGPIVSCTRYADARGAEQDVLKASTQFELPPRSNRLLYLR